MSRFAVAAAVLAFWMALGLLEAGFFSTDPRHEGMTWDLAWRYRMPAWLVFAALTPVLGLLARRFPIRPGTWARHAPIHLLLAVAFVLVHLMATNLTISLLFGRPLVPIRFIGLPRVIATYFAVDVFFYVAIVAAFHVVHYYRESRDRAVAASRLEARLADARLQALRSQLEPHFLYNTLNAISTLAMRGENAAVVETVGHLGQLLRGTLDEGRAQEIRLGEELELLEPYLAIQRVRFGQRLTVVLDIPAETRDVRVPSLILQPLVENAVHHGIATVGAGRVEIRAAHRDDRLVLEVHDSGGRQAGTPSPNGRGVGIGNTRARLEQLYGASQSFELLARPGGGTIARVTLPWRVHPVETAQADAGVAS